MVLGSLSIAVFAWLQRSTFSSQDVHIVIEGVDQISAGKEITLHIGIDNQTNIDLSSAQLTIDLPYSLQTADGKRFGVFRWDKVEAGKKLTQDFVVVAQIQGGQGPLRARLDYAPKGFTGRFVSNFEVKIEPSAFGITSVFDISTSAVPGQEIEGTLYIIPTDQLAFDTLWLQFAPPDDFFVEETSPAVDNSMRWQIKNIVKGKEYSFRFRGIVRGTEGEEKLFRVSVGSVKNSEFVALTDIDATVGLSTGPLRIEQQVQGAADGIVYPGDQITVTLNYQNASDTPINNTTIEVFLSGMAFDYTRLSSTDGVFDARTHTVIWNKTNLPTLQTLGSGEKGRVSFSIYIKEGLQPANAKDINYAISSRARISSPQQSLALGGVAFEDEKITMMRVASVMSVSAQAFRRLSNMVNTGPIPPVVGQETTYTIVWQIKNTTNDISSTQVQAILPQQVSWKNVVDPSDSRLVYNPDTHTVTWDVGTVSAGTGSIFPVAQVRFQISLVPTSDEVGHAAILMHGIRAIGTDSFTQKNIEVTANSLDTTLPDDQANAGGGMVQ